MGFSYLVSSSGDEECQLFENDYLDTTNGVPFTTSESNSETRYYNVGTNDEHSLKNIKTQPQRQAQLNPPSLLHILLVLLVVIIRNMTGTT